MRRSLEYDKRISVESVAIGFLFPSKADNLVEYCDAIMIPAIRIKTYTGNANCRRNLP